MSASNENEAPNPSRLERLLKPKRKLDEVGLKTSIPIKVAEIEENTAKQTTINELLTKLNSAADKLFDTYIAAKMNDAAHVLLTLRFLVNKALNVDEFHKNTCDNYKVDGFIDEAEAKIQALMINRNRIYTNDGNIYGTVQHLLHCFRTKEKDLLEEDKEDTMKAGIHLPPTKIRRFWRDFLKRTFLDLYKAQEAESEDPNPVVLFPNLDHVTNLEVFTLAGSHIGKLLSMFLFCGRTYLTYIPVDKLERTIALLSSDDITSHIYEIMYETKKNRTKYANKKRAGRIARKPIEDPSSTVDGAIVDPAVTSGLSSTAAESLPVMDLSHYADGAIVDPAVTSGLSSTAAESLPVMDLSHYADAIQQEEDTTQSFAAMDEVENMNLSMIDSSYQPTSVPSMPTTTATWESFNERNWASIPIVDATQCSSSSQTLDMACKELSKYLHNPNITQSKATMKNNKVKELKNKTLESKNNNKPLHNDNNDTAVKGIRTSNRNIRQTTHYSPGKNEIDPTVARWTVNASNQNA